MRQVICILLAACSIEIFYAGTSRTAAAPKLGTCPLKGAKVSQAVPCANDSTCPGEKRCCETTNGSRCVDPKELSEAPKPGNCPRVSVDPKWWRHNHKCLGDSQCPGNKKCCDHESGRMCRRPPGFPVDSKPGTCMIVWCSSPLAAVKNCHNDDQCSGKRKCCPTTSGGFVCRMPLLD